MKTIHPLELEALLEADKPVEIIDLRSIEQFEKAHIAGAHWIPMPDASVEELVTMRELPLTEPLYLVSDQPGHLRFVVEDLERENNDNIIIVEGGMEAWRRSGLPMVQNHTVADWIAERRERISALGLLA